MINNMDIQIQFILQYIHFALNLFVAFVFFAVFWLFLDAWTTQKEIKNLLKAFGFFFLSISFLVHSTYVEQIAFADQFGLNAMNLFASNILRGSGYILLILGLLKDPIQKKPHYDETGEKTFAILPFGLTLPASIPLLFGGCSAIIGGIFLHHSTKGLEKHLKPLAIVFFIISLSEFFSLAENFRSSSNVAINSLAAAFGPMWILEHVLLLIAAVILGKWVFTYLLKRLQTQLFMIMSTGIIAIFIITTMIFTFLLLQNFRQDGITHLQTDSNVLLFAMESKKEQTLSDAEVVAQNPQVTAAIASKDKMTLKNLVTSILETKKQGSLLIISPTGEVLARGEDPGRIGDSFANDSIFQHVIRGQNISSVVTKDGVLAPEISIVSGTPIKDATGTIVGVVLVGSPIDSAFVDGVRKATNLSVSVYASNILSATTFLAPDGKSRLLGIKEETPQIKKTVLENGHAYSGSVSILNVPYFAVYLPLKDSDQIPIGMLFVGSLQLGVLQAAGKSIELTFLITALLVVLSIIPAYLISKYISYQLH